MNQHKLDKSYVFIPCTCGWKRYVLVDHLISVKFIRPAPPVSPSMKHEQLKQIIERRRKAKKK